MNVNIIDTSSGRDPRVTQSVLVDSSFNLYNTKESFDFIFFSINGVFYYAAIYKQHEKLVSTPEQ